MRALLRRLRLACAVGVVWAFVGPGPSQMTWALEGQALHQPGTPPEPEDGGVAYALVEKAVAAMGGPAALDGIRTLILKGRILQKTPEGTLEAALTTTFSYPDKMRRDLILPTGDTLSTVFTPDSAFVVGALGTTTLPPEDKIRLEATAMRNPVSLLKARRHPLFRASLGEHAASEPEGDVIVIQIGDEVIEAILDERGRIVELVATEPARTAESQPARVRVGYQDFRPVGTLVYPHLAETRAAGDTLYSVQLESVRINDPVPPSLFDRPPAGPGLTPPAPQQR